MDSSQWNDRYSTDDYVWRAEPNVFLGDEVGGLAAGRALDVACGEGRNAVWLAEKGWDVTGIDFSDVGLAKGRRLAARRGVEVTWICADATTWQPPDDGFDLVVAFYLQLPADERRRALEMAARASAPGATILVVAHDTTNLTGGTGGPPDPAVLYASADVIADLEGTGLDFAVERAGIVERHVDGTDRPALDCLVRVRRPG